VICLNVPPDEALNVIKQNKKHIAAQPVVDFIAYKQSLNNLDLVSKVIKKHSRDKMFQVYIHQKEPDSWRWK